MWYMMSDCSYNRDIIVHYRHSSSSSCDGGASIVVMVVVTALYLSPSHCTEESSERTLVFHYCFESCFLVATAKL